MHNMRQLRYNGGMLLHNLDTGETTAWPQHGQLSYDVRGTGQRIVLHKKPFGIVLEVVNGPVLVNGRPVAESALLLPGDHLQLGQQVYLLVQDENLPPEVTLPCPAKSPALFQPDDEEGSLAFPDDNPAQTVGLRWLTGPRAGQFQPLPSGKSWACGPIHLIANDDGLALCPSSDNTSDTNQARINGFAVFAANDSAVGLLHNDVVACGPWRFRTEIPGTAGRSAFSPSHPHNIQLSEEYLAEDQPVVPEERKANNNWLWALATGLLILSVLTFWLKT